MDQEKLIKMRERLLRAGYTTEQIDQLEIKISNDINATEMFKLLRAIKRTVRQT